MISKTISDVATIQGGAEATLLAGRYRIVRQLGQGGMGSVWLAEDMQLDNKQFAIKMLPSILVSNKRAYRQLKDEALVAMQLIHPNIVQIRAFEENNGNPFLVMDYIDGETLDDYLAEVGNGEEGTGNGRAASTRPPSGGLPEDEVIRLLKPIAAALDYAHGEGVVHRDVKPANVMIRKDGHPFILDFGIAREIQETMTRVTGKLSSGTLLYMSPEQLNGDMPTSAQDVYSFAAMVYECLKGEPPFSRGNIEFQIMNKMPAPLDPHFAKSGSVMQGLEKKPEDRPKTCAGVLEGNASPRGGARTRRNEDGRASTYAEATVDKECVDGNNFSHKGHKDRKEAGRGVPTAPHGMPVSTRPPERNVSGIALPIFCIVAALLVLGGGLWYRGQQRKQAEWRRIVAAQKAEEEARQRAEDERRAQEAAHEKMLAVEKSARDRDSCIANLKQIEAAMEQCLIGGKIPTPEHLYGPDRYLRNEPTCPLGGHYKINKSDEGYTVVCPHADEGHRWPLSGAPNIITANWEVVPSARLVSKVGSREVFGATFRMDGLEYTSPVVLDNLQGRASIGPFKVTYSENNKRYEGAFTAIPINWRGSKTYTFSLKEITAPRHGDARKRVQLWEGGPYWATVNIGAEEPWERGCYFWWGDTVGYKRVGDSWVASDGSRRGFSFKEGNVPTYNKSSSTLRSEGWIIEGGILAPEHDAAQVQWGGGWRMPTGQELSGLNNKCDFTWATKNGVEGYIVRGRGDYASNSIFLPCAGYGDGTSLYSAGAGGHYWSSVPRSDYYYAWDLNFDSSYPYADYSNRSNGQSVRPVQGFTK